MGAGGLIWTDWLAIALYFLLVIIVGQWATCRAFKTTASGYFLAGADMTWIPIGASMFATNFGASTLVGLVGSAAASGFAPALYEWHAAYIILALGWLFIPVYIACGCTTMPEYLRKRYGGQRLRTLLTAVRFVTTIIGVVSAEMYAGAMIVQYVLGWDLYISLGVVLALTVLYTIFGGLQSVMYLDTLQTLAMVIGSILLAGISITKVGGYKKLTEQFVTSAANDTLIEQALYGNRSCGLPPKNSLRMFRGIHSDYPWTGMLFGLTIMAVNTWCTDQVCTQRCLSTRNLSHAKAGSVFASFLKLLPFFVAILPGMISRILFPGEVACADPATCLQVCGNPSGCYNIAYPLLVMRLLPAGLRGLVLATILAAMMSSLSSVFNSVSSNITMNFIKPCISCVRKRPYREIELMVVGRIICFLMAGISVAWLPVLDIIQGSQLWEYIQSVAAYTAPPIAVCFLLGVFWKRATEKGAFWGLITGFTVGIIRLVLTVVYPEPPCGTVNPASVPEILLRVHFLHFALIVAAVTLLVMVSLSLVTEPRSPAQLRRVTWWTRQDHADECKPMGTEGKVPAPPTENVTSKYRDLEFEIAEEGESKNSCGRCIGHWMCGASRTDNECDPDEEYKRLNERAMLTEKSHWRRLLDISALVCIVLVTFLIGFYA